MGRERNDLTEPQPMLPATESPESLGEGALLSWIQQFAPYGIITLDESFRIETWNHWMEIHSSKRFEAVRGMDLFAVFPDLRERRLVSHFQRALEGEACVLSTTLHQYLLPLPSPFPEPGAALMLQTARIAPLFSDGKVCGLVVVIEDVTQRETQAEALRRQHRRDEILSWALAHLLKAEEPRKTVRQLFFKVAEYLDFDSFLLYLRNPETGVLSLYETGGLSIQSQDFTSCPFTSLMDPESQRLVVLDGVQARLEPQFLILKQAGVSAAVAIPLMANNRNLGMLCFATWSRSVVASGEADLLTIIGEYLATALDRETTSRQLYNAKEELGEHARLLEKRVQERTAQLQESISELETFTYTLAHDLKAPIRGLTGYCNILLEDFSQDLSPKVDLIVKKLARTSKRMEVLIRDLLAFSKVSQQQVVLSCLEIEPLIEDILALRAPEVKKAVAILKPLHPVIAHKELLKQVLSNLIDNAWKFVRPQASPQITIRTEIVFHSAPSTRCGTLLFSSTDKTKVDTQQVETPGEHIRLWVVDHGIGIPREVHHKIFGIFERGVTSQTYEGTGMGLAIVARAMQRMGGTCGVESEPDKGSQFWIILPAAQTTQGQPAIS